jgi:hypothetical protein
MTATFRSAAAAILAAGLFAALPAAAQTTTVPGPHAPRVPSMRADASAITATLRKHEALGVRQAEIITRQQEARPQMQRLAEVQTRPVARSRTR